jgi:hypothetical protein
MLTIFVDADACPVKAEVCRVAGRYGLTVCFVACSPMRLPVDSRVSLHVVEKGPDAADDWIVEQIAAHDLVITGDIPLAHRCLQKGALGLGFTGRPFTSDNIGSLLATRDLLAHLREGGEITGGPPPFAKQDRSRFLQELDRIIVATRRAVPG